MATSGTIGLTKINTAKVLEKALRRCGLPAQSATPEIVSNAMEDLFMLLMSLSNRGLNLWCIDHQIIPLAIGQATYVLPEGTLDVLNLLHCTPTRIDYQETYEPTYTLVEFDDPTTVTGYGVKFSVLPTAPYEFQFSDDGVTWTTVEIVTTMPNVNVYGWSTITPQITAKKFRIYSTALGTQEDFFLTNGVREIMVTPFNRDDYAAQPNKTFLSYTATNFWFEKLVTPQITLWPVPSDDTRYLSLYRYRQIQDIGDLTDEIELPSRWYEAITWHLAARLAFELPGVEPDRRKEVVAMANSMTIEVEGGETDSSPTYFAPNIRVYTRG